MVDIVTFIESSAKELGFEKIGISKAIIPNSVQQQFNIWLQNNYHGNMEYMQNNKDLRFSPKELVPESCSVISVAIEYLATEQSNSIEVLDQPHLGYISRYSLGRDYHKLIRKRLTKLAKKIEQELGCFTWRGFTDSAPVLEKSFAETSGIGWRGKHSMILNRNGSWFFLGELFTNLALPTTATTTHHCGSCTRCIDVCPTQAIVSPYKMDASRCIAYLTIEHKGSIPVEFRHAIGNRVYGCDDCQLFCPWNKFSRISKEPDFAPRNNFAAPDLLELFNWSEQQFLDRTAGSAIRRIGHSNWLRNIAIALGNALYLTKSPEASSQIITALKQHSNHPSEIVREHVEWAIGQNNSKYRVKHLDRV